ncbi:MAG: GC-type dockerin domain-anchored protein, partial [Planctomyces sp.]
NSLGQMGDDESSLSQYVQLNTDATIVVYASKADNLVPGDGNGYMEVFLTRRTNGPVTPGCSPADVANTDGDPIPDDAIDNGDFSTFFTAFFAAEGDPFRLVADIANTDGETIVEGGGPDGVVDNGDFAAFFVYFFQGCP